MRVIDGEVGGIYRDDDSNSVEVIYDGLHHVTSCAAFDFGKTFDVDHVEVNAKASKSTCGHHCVEGAGCAMGNFYYVYVGPSLVLQDAKFVTQTTLNPPDSTIRTYPVSNNFPRCRQALRLRLPLLGRGRQGRHRNRRRPALSPLTRNLPTGSGIPACVPSTWMTEPRASLKLAAVDGCRQ